MTDHKRNARKIKRQLKADRPKIIALCIATCLAAPMPYAGLPVALVAGILAFALVGRGFLALHNFELELGEAELTDVEIERIVPSYKPVIVNAAVCLVALVAASVVVSKLSGVVAQLLNA